MEALFYLELMREIKFLYKIFTTLLIALPA
jgi:hypothetical protein